ncbi:MAG: hypothetical protein ACI88A_002986 [Paraglaciecola sp.]|jgi:uncharacterized protein (DUF342 family)
MRGVSLQVDDKDKFLNLVIAPDQVGKKLTIGELEKLVNQSEFKHFFIFEQSLIDAIENFASAVKKRSDSIITECIGERRHAEVKCRVLEDELSAVMTVTCGYAGKSPSLLSLQKSAKKVGLVRGVSQKRLAKLLNNVKTSAPGTIIEETIAIGLPPRNGRPSKLKPLVKNALERILMPQQSVSNRVDMRNLGDVICVKAGTELLRRLPPTEGRAGYSVTGAVLKPLPGEWLKIRPGDGTIVSESDSNLLLASIAGMPKFKDPNMWVDDTFICKGVNVGSGNVNFDGAVLVNGDVTEKMNIVATGDVTINGFVESATISAGGDIIITEGAMGKVNDLNTIYSTVLRAKGSIHIQHGQGVDLSCGGDVSIGRQLAHSKITCRGKVTVGPIDRPNGNIFGCIIKSHKKVSAGTFGAVSGSNLSIDFSDGFNTLLERKDTLDELVRLIKQNNTRHNDRMKIINSKFVPEEMQHRVDEAKELFQNETQLLQWLETKANEMNESKDKYQQDIAILANKRVYPGVVIKLNNRTWRAQREYGRSQVSFHGHQWHCEPLM